MAAYIFIVTGTPVLRVHVAFFDWNLGGYFFFLNYKGNNKMIIMIMKFILFREIWVAKFKEIRKIILYYFKNNI